MSPSLVLCIYNLKSQKLNIFPSYCKKSLLTVHDDQLKGGIQLKKLRRKGSTLEPNENATFFITWALGVIYEFQSKSFNSKDRLVNVPRMFCRRSKTKHFHAPHEWSDSHRSSSLSMALDEVLTHQEGPQEVQLCTKNSSDSLIFVNSCYQPKIKYFHQGVVTSTHKPLPQSTPQP